MILECVRRGRSIGRGFKPFAFRFLRASLHSLQPAIYVDSRSYQTAHVEGRAFAIVGHYPETDSQMLSVQLAR